MGLRELRAKHGRPGAKPRQAINLEMRARYPGGAELLDALELVHHMLERHGWRDPDGRPTPLAQAYLQLQRIQAAMEDHVRKRFDMPPRPWKPSID